jgi:hypothetical protein
MQWKFDSLELTEKRIFATFSIEGGTSGFLKRFAAARKISRAHAARGLISEAVRYWLKHRQSLERRNPYPWAVFEERGLPVQELSVRLDPDILEGLREISTASQKSVSKVVSEILLDAKNASMEIEQAHNRFGRGERASNRKSA